MKASHSYTYEQDEHELAIDVELDYDMDVQNAEPDVGIMQASGVVDDFTIYMEGKTVPYEFVKQAELTTPNVLKINLSEFPKINHELFVKELEKQIENFESEWFPEYDDEDYYPEY